MAKVKLQNWKIVLMSELQNHDQVQTGGTIKMFLPYLTVTDCFIGEECII